MSTDRWTLNARVLLIVVGFLIRIASQWELMFYVIFNYIYAHVYVAGQSGLGKSTLVNSLFLTDLYPDRVIPTAAGKDQQHEIEFVLFHQSM